MNLHAIPEIFLCDCAGSIKKKKFSGPAHLIMLTKSNSSENASNHSAEPHSEKKMSSSAPWRICRLRRDANATLSWHMSATRLPPLHKNKKNRHTIFRNGHSTGNFRSRVPLAPKRRYGRAFFCKRTPSDEENNENRRRRQASDGKVKANFRAANVEISSSMAYCTAHAWMHETLQLEAKLQPICRFKPGPLFPNRYRPRRIT